VRKVAETMPILTPHSATTIHRFFPGFSVSP
jgi:hypothetical protein